jgi:lipopolysaccharide export system permease protein
MNNKINNYLIFGYCKILINWILVFICLGVILNLFEEIEFFKNINSDIFLPIILTLSYIPNLIFINLMPFIIFLSAMWYFLSIKQSSELLTLKVFGYSNLKIISIISAVAFFWGIFILFIINPVTSNMVKYYEQTKSNYSKDTDHLVTINRNGVWIKEKQNSDLVIINADKLENNFLLDISINIISEENLIQKRIEAKKANVVDNLWILENPKIFKFNKDGNISFESKENLEFVSFYNLKKLNSLYKNLDTISFIELISDYKNLILRGYEKSMVSEKINSFFALPFFLILMIILAAIFTINNRSSNNINYLLIAVLTCAIIYYMKDLSVALGKSDRLSPELSVWIPIIVIGLINSIGLLQINEK